MNGGLALLLTMSFTLILVMIQRSEQRRRRVVAFFMLLVVLLIGWWAFKTNSVGEMLLGLLFGGLISGLFWLLVGRYNPVGSSDDIKVLGLDD